ncbi:hypothetical protein [Actinophytocola sp.]|uniref:hypothetical protein n=1 Tax=Actinophytocola sp. TaxID=1872138 RepID=UPI002ED43E12
MIEPNGPLPQYVYWRRRALAAGVSVLAVVLLVWLIGGLVEADDQQPVQGTAGLLPPATSTRVSTPPSSPSVSVTTSPSPTTSGTVSPPAPSPTPPPQPGPPGPCPDAAMRVAATPAAPSYPVGARPLLRLEITNAGPVPCVRDLSRQLREVVVLAQDGTRLWSSNDCYGQPKEDVRLLPVNEPAVFSVNWAGRTSAPGCPANRSPVPAGSYQVLGRLGALISPPAPLTLT